MGTEALLTGVTVHRDAFGDPRYTALAELAGFANHYEALGRMTTLWSICTALGSDTPPRQRIVVCLGKQGPEAIVEADLGELMPDGQIRVKGCEGRIGWHAEVQRRGAVGGATRAATAPRQGGRFTKEPPIDPDQQPPATTSEPPATTSEPPANHQRPPAGDQRRTSVHQAKIKNQINPDQASQKPVGESVELSTRRTRATHPGELMPDGWEPDSREANAKAELEAARRGALVDHERSKFFAWARAEGVRRADWNAAWQKWLLEAYPARKQVRDAHALVATEQRRDAKIAEARKGGATERIDLGDARAALEAMKAVGLNFDQAAEQLRRDEAKTG